MAADGKRRKVIRKHKAKKAGADRKKQVASSGSTPKLSVLFGDEPSEKTEQN
ncbi:MAG: hypothetical protein VYA34_15360 [Myxococcota bacterium]|nr:hypothetical protein [Myxococcota bacterium]